jgi:molecular chaperone DnaK (HSP70)
VAGPVVGIDLGTLNSCVAVVKDGKAVVLADENRTTTPSCVAIHQGRELVGAAAKRHAVTSPQNTVIAVKRLIGHTFESNEVQAAAARLPYTLSPSPLGGVVLEVGDAQLTPVEVSAKILQRVKEVAEKALGEPVTQAVISVPAHFNDVQRKATKLAAEYAGLEVLRLINEPTAAAFAYGYKKHKDFTLAVYDLGGGTFDVTVMRARGNTFEVVATDGDSYLGGEDFDYAIAEWLEQEFKKKHGTDLSADPAARLRLKEAAEKAKIELAAAEVANIDLPFLAKIEQGEQVNFTCTLSRKQMVALCKPLIERTLELCERCLSTARISRGEVGEVLLVGGQSRMLAVRDGVKDFFSKEPRRDINPDEVVAVGAALYAYSLSADALQQEAHDAAEDAFEVALRQTEVARKIVKEVEELRARPLDDQGLAARLQTLLQATEADGTLPPEFEETDPGTLGPITFGVTEPEEDDSPRILDNTHAPVAKPAAKPAPKPSGAPARKRSAITLKNRPSRSAAEEEDLPTAVKGLKDELLQLDYKAAELIEQLALDLDNGDGEASKLIEVAKERLNESLTSAKGASEEALQQIKTATEHKRARRVNLRDVTSLPLGIASAGDLFTVLIDQNVVVPAQLQRIFTTNQDGQAEVEIRVFQGRGKTVSDNQLLGSFILEGIAPVRRMEPKIEVAFRIDENGILAVTARDADSGVQQGIRIEDPLGLQQVEPAGGAAEPEAAPTPGGGGFEIER